MTEPHDRLPELLAVARVRNRQIDQALRDAEAVTL
jgi:hypothetical protein